MESLLKNCSYPNIQGNKGNTPLHVAISKENLPAVKLLLAHGANLFVKNEEEKTPYDLSQGKVLVNDLFLNDKEINSIVRVRVHNSKLDELEEFDRSNKRYISQSIDNILNSCQVIRLW